jgi:hypothetical protein
VLVGRRARTTAARGAPAPSPLPAALPTEIQLVFDELDPACLVPGTISCMKLVLNAPVETAALREWAIRYELRP